MVPPLTYTDFVGVARGAAVDVVAEIMEMVGSPISRYDIRHISWARAVEDVEHTPGTMIFCMARTPEREDKFKWVGPIAEINVGLLARRTPRIVIRSSGQVKQYRIGAVRNSGPAEILKNKYGVDDKNLTLLPSDTLQFKMLAAGRVDLITQADIAAPSWLEKLSLNREDFEIVHVLQHMYLYIAFNRATDDSFIQKAQEALANIQVSADGQPSRYDILVNKHLVGGPLPLQTNE